MASKHSAKGSKTRTPKRVQGIDKGVDDLILRGGKGLALELGPGIEPTPTLTRTINGASSISLDVFDPERILLRNSLLAQKWEVEIDGLGFRYVGLAKQEKTLTLTLEDEWVAILKEKLGPVSVKRANSTRAEFIKRLVEEACPGLDFYCPQLHRKQPIGSKKEAKEAKEETRENRGKGIGDQKHLKVKGQTPTAAQKELGNMALEIADRLGAPFVVQVALIAALIDENNMEEPNVLQAEQELTGPGGEGAPVGSPAEEISGFLTNKPEWTGEGAIAYHRAHPTATADEIAAAVQKNLAGASDYARFVSEAREWVEAFGGEGGSGSISVTKPVRFEVQGKKRGRKRPENYWEAIKRLAKEVNWRAFIVADRFYFMPEPELFEGEVRLAIDSDTPGIENIDFEYNIHGDVTELTVTALVAQWKPPPGSVVTLEDYGPASLGPGDPPRKRGEPAVSSAVKASTHEGRGRYLVSSIEVPLSNDPAQRLATITLKTPTKPLPEKRATRESIDVGSVGAAGNKTVERMLAAADREVAKKLEYIWGGFDPAKGFDCSGWVSWLLGVGGFMEGRTDTRGLAAWGQAGPGKWITVYVKTGSGMSAEEEHTMIEIAGNFYMSGGGENSNPNGGPCKFTPSDSYKEEFNVKRHPAGY